MLFQLQVKANNKQVVKRGTTSHHPLHVKCVSVQNLQLFSCHAVMSAPAQSVPLPYTLNASLAQCVEERLRKHCQLLSAKFMFCQQNVQVDVTCFAKKTDSGGKYLVCLQYLKEFFSTGCRSENYFQLKNRSWTANRS